MTETFRSLTVMLQKDLGEEGTASLMAAIGRLRGVANVYGNTAGATAAMAKASTRQWKRQNLANGRRE